MRPSPLTPSLIPPIAAIPASRAPTSSKVTKTYGSTSRASLPASSAPWSSAGEILYGSQRLEVSRAPILSSSRELRRSSRVRQTPRAQTRASQKQKTPKGNQEYNPEAEVDELASSPSKQPRLKTPPAPEMEVIVDPPEVQTRSPSPTVSLPGTLFPNHFPSQILPLPPVVYKGPAVKRTNNRLLMKRELPLSQNLQPFRNHLHQLDDYSPLVKANERLVQESNRRLQDFTGFICGSCTQLGHDYCDGDEFGVCCEECDVGHRACSKAMTFGGLLDSLEQTEATSGLSTHGKAFGFIQFSFY